MVITQTPFRMSFFGGGTDFPDFYNEHGGAAISTTMDKHCWVTVRHLPPFFEYKTHLTYSKIEGVNSYDEIKHPAIRECMRHMDMHEIRLTYDADLPAQSGLGTSSSFAVGMINAFYCLKGKYADKRKLADDAIHLERVLCNEAGGIQDQIAAAFGGLNKIIFRSDGYTVDPIIISNERKEELNENLMLMFTGFSRFSSDVQQSTMRAIKDKAGELREILSLVGEAEKILTDKQSDLNEFGRLLDYTWKLKRGITTSVSTNEIDELYDIAKAAGASGGKLLGAGGGGFLLLYVEKEKQTAVKKALSRLLHVPFRFESEGARVIHFAPEPLRDREE